MSSFYRKQLEDWLKKLEVSGERVLDVGGAQLPVKGRTASWDVKDYQILDLPVPHQGEAPGIKFDLNAAANEKVQAGDVVFCLEVMEYVWDPETAMFHLRELTKDGGILHITFPYFYPPHEPYQEDCLRYTLSGAKKLLREADFSVEQVVARQCIGTGQKTAIEMNALRPSKNATHDELFYTLGYIITAKAI